MKGLCVRDLLVSYSGMVTGGCAVASVNFELAQRWVGVVGGILFCFSTLLSIVLSVRALKKK
jgi:tellurite resistance protein TehA-like permease